MTAHWSMEIIEAAERWRAAEPAPRSNTDGWRRVGEVKPDGDRLVLDVRDNPKGVSTLVEPCLAGHRGPGVDVAYPVDEIRNADDVLVIQAPPGLPAGSRHLWARSMSPRFLLEKLVQGLRAAGDAPLARALAEKRLSAPPTTGPEAVGLFDAQLAAFRACLTPGVHLVWGPPGTGKTQVLARAIEQLMRSHKRVLLVSTANVAVDNALAAVVRRVKPSSGSVLRVGPAHTAEIAGNPHVQLDRLAATATRAADDERDQMAAQLRAIDTMDEEVDALQSELGDFDDAAYRSAEARLEAERDLADLSARLRVAEARVESAEGVMSSSSTALRAAEAENASFDPIRRALDHERQAGADIEALDRELHVRRIERAALAARPPTGWAARLRHQRQVTRATDELRRFTADASGARRRLLNIQLAARTVVGATGEADLDAMDARRSRARADADRAEAEWGRAQEEFDRLVRLADAARARGMPREDDRLLVRRCASLGLPAKHTRLHELVDRRKRFGARRSELEDRHRRLTDRSRALRRNAEAQLINEAQVVATTLARSRLPPIATTTFDVVLVDEAGAATLAEVVLALCRARTTAVLFGDFLQLGPVIDGKVRKDPHPGLATWVRGTCFSHVGIKSPADVEDNGRCIALTHQFRFGPGLRRLANAAVYQVLRDGWEVHGSPPPQTEVVLVDVSPVPELAVVRTGGAGGRWWMAGVVLSRALARVHVEEGVGVVAPYRAQVEATLAALRDLDVVGAAVGTVHAFQGREYPTVVFDLVEDGNGWIATAGRHAGEWEYDWLRLFGVGITRARSRLYLIANGERVRTARTGPLAEVRQGIERGEIERWSAAAMLGMAEPPPGPVDSTFAEVSEHLQQLVSVSDIHDEHSFGRELAQHLDAARRSVWMWSPWVTNRAREVVPLIRSAAARGVDVRVFIRPDEDRLMATPAAQKQLPGLQSSGAIVIRSDHEHRKIVVIDDETVLLGSLNALSNRKGSSRETMITMSGQMFAARLLTELRVTEIGMPRPCPACGPPMEVRRSGGRRPALFWRCRTCLKRMDVPAGDRGRRNTR